MPAAGALNCGDPKLGAAVAPKLKPPGFGGSVLAPKLKAAGVAALVLAPADVPAPNENVDELF